MRLWIGSNKINPMIGDNVIDEDFRKFAVKTQLDNVCKILNGKIQYSTLLDHKGVLKRKVSITYAYEEEK
jgi:hypothetical protein